MGTNEKSQMVKVNFKLQLNKVVELKEFLHLKNVWTIS